MIEDNESDLLKWRCGICKELRDYDCISTITYPIKGLRGAARNVNYCNDNQSCLYGAMEKKKSGKI